MTLKQKIVKKIFIVIEVVLQNTLEEVEENRNASGLVLGLQNL